MKTTALKERINEYKKSIKTVVDKKIIWETETKKLLISTLNKIVDTYDIDMFLLLIRIIVQTCKTYCC